MSIRKFTLALHRIVAYVHSCGSGRAVMRRALAAVVGGVIALAACGGGGGEARDSTTDTAAGSSESTQPEVGEPDVELGPAPDCSLLTAETVEEIVGVGVVTGRAAFVNEDVTLLPQDVERSTVCNYDGETLGGLVSVLIYEYADASTAESVFEETEAFERTEGATIDEIDGLGDRATFYNNSKFIVLSGSRLLDVNASAVGDDPEPTPQQEEALATLATELFG